MKGPGWCSSVRGLGRTGGGTSSGTSQRHLPEAGRRCDSTGRCHLQGLAPKGRPDLLCMGVVLVTDMRIRELAVEGFFWKEFGLSEAILGAHILLGVNTLPY